MTMKSSLSRGEPVSRNPHTSRQVVVPDRTIKRSSAVAPIINSPPKIHPSTVRRGALKSSSLHASPQVPQLAQARAHNRKAFVASDMEKMLKRHSTLPRHLARTAGRAQLLSSALSSETYNISWRQKFISKFTNGFFATKNTELV